MLTDRFVRIAVALLTVATRNPTEEDEHAKSTLGWLLGLGLGLYFCSSSQWWCSTQTNAGPGPCLKVVTPLPRRGMSRHPSDLQLGFLCPCHWFLSQRHSLCPPLR